MREKHICVFLKIFFLHFLFLFYFLNSKIFFVWQYQQCTRRLGNCDAPTGCYCIKGNSNIFAISYALVAFE